MSNISQSALQVNNPADPEHAGELLAFDRRATTHLVGKGGLVKEGLKSLLTKTNFQVTGEYEEIEKMPGTTPEGKPVHIVIAMDEGTGGISGMVQSLKQRYSSSHIVIVSAAGIPAPDAVSALSAGLDGYILRDISCEGLVSSLRLVMSGERVCPASMLAAAANAPSGDLSSFTNVKGKSFSKRELDIIHKLANGDPNKVIASKLDIAEATVKVHVKTILRKLGVTNRTQAAIMAISQGITTGAGERAG